MRIVQVKTLYGVNQIALFFLFVVLLYICAMKIESEKLNQIVSLRKQIGEVTMEISSLEIQKHNALHKYSALQTALNTINNELTKEFGEDAQIDLSTGEVTKAPQEKNKVKPLIKN